MINKHHISATVQGLPKFSSIKVVIMLLINFIMISKTCFAVYNNLYDLSIEEILNIKVNIATKTDIRIDAAPSIVSVITSTEIQQMGARDLPDVLRVVPGFDLTNVVVVENQMAIVRGLRAGNSNNRIKTLINGRSSGEG